MKRKLNPKKLVALGFMALMSGFYMAPDAKAQVPQKFNYQGIARDSKGNPLSKQQLAVKLTVLPTEDATMAEYEETQLISTNEFGLYTLQIGNGTPVLGEMKTVKWETGNKYIRVAIDPTGGSNYVDAGTTQLLSVPYAIYADKAGIARETVGGEHGGTRSGNVSTSAAGTGTVNFLTKFTAANTIYNSQVFDNGTNVGLGTITPSAKFHIFNNAAVVQEHLRMQNLNSAGAGRFTMYNDDATKYATFTKYGTTYAGGYPGVTTQFPYANLLAFGNNSGGFLISNSGSVGLSLFKGGTSKLKLFADFTTENLSLGGNAIPATQVHFNSAVSGDTLKITNSTTGHLAADGLDIRMAGNAASMVNRENSSLEFGTNNLTRATIDATGKVGIGITSPASKLHVTDASTAFTNGIIRGEYTGPAVSVDIVGVYGQSLALSNWGIGVRGVGNYYGVNGHSDAATGVYGSSNSGNGVRGFSSLGIGLIGSSSLNYGLYASADSMAAGYFLNSSANSPALYNGVLVGEYTGNAVQDYVGIYGKNTNTLGYGVGTVGEGGWIGVKGMSPYYGVYGVVTNNGNGNAVYGNGSTYGTGVAGFSFAGNAMEAYSTDGNGVESYSGNGVAINGIGDSNSAGYFTSGNGSLSPALYNEGVVHGEYLGNYAQDAIGVMGRSTPSSTIFGIGVSGLGNWIGVKGSANGTGNYAGYFDGLLYATSASSGIKAFKIDHPTDPANKYLVHSSIESNDMMNIYNGNITTDANGDAIVSLPSYFEALNIDFKYQLTVIGTFAQAIISEEVHNNQFKIKTNQPNVKVSWQVSGVRNDAMAQAHRIVAEVDKVGKEKGKFLNPVENGQPETAGIGYVEKSKEETKPQVKRNTVQKHEEMMERMHPSTPMQKVQIETKEAK
ncbi:MAG: hypothetical protein IPI46_07090 [Bacteroidetes bacterium]|nr:hypothetical protein [Bacteroidota bacterium]